MKGMTMSDDLVKRLRTHAARIVSETAQMKIGQTAITEHDDRLDMEYALDEAADRIEALEAENARLRGAANRAMDRLAKSRFANAEHVQANETLARALAQKSPAPE